MGAQGLILIDKPPGVTSFRALGSIKRALNTRKVGHSGTLDPFATGLMVVLAGGYTRLADHITGLEKRYEATVRFGEETDTLDCDGSVTVRCDPPDFARLSESLAAFVGRIEQQPPAYSAVKIDGRRAHELARSGVQVKCRTRSVEVYELTLLDYVQPLARIAVHCSKGTYIRSLARDIARTVGSCAHLQELRRTSVGPFRVDDAVSPDRFDPQRDLMTADQFIDRVPGVSRVTVDAAAARRIAHGGTVGASDIMGTTPASGLCALFDGQGQLLALADFEGGWFRYRCVLAAAP